MTDNSELKRLAEALLASDDHADFPGWMAASDEFDNATGPAAVLALIAQIERDELALRAFSSVAENAVAERNQLKAESDLLRKLASGTGQELRKASSWICREVEAGTKSATHWAVRLREKADQIDAAMGKGEQS